MRLWHNKDTWRTPPEEAELVERINAIKASSAGNSSS